MELRDAILRRRMVRSYDPDRPIPRETVDKLLELAIRAPSAGHTQGWRFLVLDDPASCARFWAATVDDEAPDTWLERMQRAPVLVIFFSDRDAYLDRYAEPDKGWTDRDEAHWPVPYWHIDVGMAALLMMLTAIDEGLGTCLIGILPEHLPPFRAEFGIPEALEPIGAVTVGHRSPEEAPNRARFAARRRPAADVIHRGRWAPR
jgi:nitroreductase